MSILMKFVWRKKSLALSETEKRFIWRKLSLAAFIPSEKETRLSVLLKIYEAYICNWDQDRILQCFPESKTCASRPKASRHTVEVWRGQENVVLTHRGRGALLLTYYSSIEDFLSDLYYSAIKSCDIDWHFTKKKQRKFHRHAQSIRNQIRQ